MLSNPLRYAFDEASKAATQFIVGDPGKPPVAEDDEPGLEGKDFYSPERATFASGMHAVIVETDPDTAEIKILKYAVVHDCGHLINPMIVEGQIHGGVAQGVGGALYERMAYDESGQLLNASFMDFLMPYVTEIPDGIDIDHLETPSPLNPLGIKGAGEAGRDPVGGRVRRRHRGRRGHHDQGDADLAVRAVRPRSRRGGCAATVSRPRGGLMKIAGANTVPYPGRAGLGRAARPRRCWSRTIPGCERLEATGENTYAMTVTAGVAAIKGTYAGTCALSDLKEHESLVMRLPGRRRSRHGRRDRRRVASRRPATAAPQIAYEADAIVGGMVGGVGQRMLGSVSKRMAGEFFGNVGKSLSRRASGGSCGGGERPGPAAHRPSPGCSPPPRRPAASPRRTTSSRASPSAPAWCSPA